MNDTKKILLTDLYLNLIYKFGEEKFDLYLDKENNFLYIGKDIVKGVKLVLGDDKEYFIIRVELQKDSNPKFYAKYSDGITHGFYCSYQVIELIKDYFEEETNIHTPEIGQAIKNNDYNLVNIGVGASIKKEYKHIERAMRGRI